MQEKVMDETGTDIEHPARRITDRGLNVKVGREVPLWGVLTLICIAAAASASMQLGLNEQGRIIREQTETIRSMDAKITSLNNAITESRIKATEHDFKVGDLERRVQGLETRIQGLEYRKEK